MEKQYKIYGTDDQEIPMRIQGHYSHIDDAIANAEYAFESVDFLVMVEVYHDHKFHPVARVDENGIHELVATH